MTEQQKQSKAIYARVNQLMQKGMTTPEMTKVMRKEKYVWRGKLITSNIVSKWAYRIRNYGVPKYTTGRPANETYGQAPMNKVLKEHKTDNKLDAIRTIVNLPNVVSDQDKLCLINNLVN